MHDNCCIRTVQEYICYKQTLNSEIIRHNTCVIMYSSVTAFEYEGISLGNSLLLIINNKKKNHMTGSVESRRDSLHAGEGMNPV